jgi:hypothetical protein
MFEGGNGVRIGTRVGLDASRDRRKSVNSVPQAVYKTQTFRERNNDLRAID